MNMHKQRTTGFLKSALLVSGMAVAAGWLSLAHAQDLEFAQRFLGAETGESDSVQYRSTIIDPSRPGKPATINSSNLRVIPISNPSELTSEAKSCGICGVVESISITLQELQGPDVRDESAIEDIAKHHGKDKGNFLMLRNTWVDTDYVMTRQSKKSPTIYEVKVRMNDGTLRIVNETRQPEYTVGDYVRVISGAVTAA
jgi:hypothetical protein